MAQDINEILDILDFIEIVGIKVGKEASGDGLQVMDALKFLADEDVRQELAEAADGITLAMSQATDIDLVESFVLARRALDMVQNVMAAFRGDYEA